MASGASELYPALGELVEALAKELGWPVGSSTAEKFLALRAEKVLPERLTQDHPATPTTVVSLMQGLVQRARTHGDNEASVISALMRAAAASRAPMPAFQPEHVSPSPPAASPADSPEREAPESPAVSVVHPVPVVPFGHPHPGFTKPQGHPKDPHKFPVPRKKAIPEFPRSIFAPGESPAERGAGVFPRQ